MEAAGVLPAQGAPGDPPQYTYTGVVAWMESEWRRFHKEREVWQNEKALLCASVEQLKHLLRASRAAETMLGRKVKLLDAKLTAKGGSGGVDLADINVEEDPNTDISQPHAALHTEDHAGQISTLQTSPQHTESISPVALQAPSEEKEQKEKYDTHEGSSAGSVAGEWEATSSRSQVPPYVPMVSPSHTTERESSFANKHPSEKGGDTSPRGELPRSPQAGTNLQPPTAALPAPVAVSSPRGSNARPWEFKACVRGHFSSVRCGTWCEGALMVTGGDDHVVKLWDARRVLKGKEREEPLTTFRGHTAPVVSLASYKDEVLAGALDGKIRIWKLPGDAGHSSRDKDRDDSGSIHSVSELSDHRNAVWGLSVLKRTSGGEEGGLDAFASALYFASVSCDGSMLLWKRVDRVDKVPAVICRFAPTEEMLGDGPFCPIHCHLSSARLVVTYVVGKSFGIAAFQTTGGGANLWHRALQARPTSLGVSPSAQLAAVGMQSGRFELFTPTDGRATIVANPHTAPISSIDFAQQDIVLTTGHDGRVLALSTVDAAVVQQLPSPHTKRFGEAINVVMHQAGRNIVATAGADSSIAWFSVASTK